MATNRTATKMDPDPNVDMMDIDDDFSDDELNAFLEAHGLDDQPDPYLSGPKGRGQQRPPQSKWEEQQGPPPSAQRQPYLNSERKKSGWKGKEKAVYLEQDEDRPPPSAQRPLEPSSGRKNSKWKGKEKAYGQGDVLGLDDSARSRRGGSAGLGDSAGYAARKARVDMPGRETGFGKGDVLGLDAPSFLGQRVTKVQNWLQTMDVDGEGDVNNVEGEGQRENAIEDPYDSEVSIAARPIVSHDPDHPNRPIDLDVKAARGVVRHVVMTEKYPEVWPAPKTGAEWQTAAEGGAEVTKELGKGGEGEGEGEKVEAGGEKGAGAEKRNEGGKGTEDAAGRGEMEREVTVEGENGSEELKGKKEVIMPKGVVMLVTSIQYLKMPSDTPSGSEVGSEYGYEDDSQGGSTPPSEPWNDKLLPPGNKEAEKGYEDYGDHSMGENGEEDYDMEDGEGPLKEAREKAQETDLEDNEDSDIPMSNADYLLPPSSPAPPPSQQPSLKRTWSQRQDNHPSSLSSSSSSFPSRLDPYQDDPYHGIPPPPHPPSSSSLPSQPPMGPPNLLIRLLLYDGEFWVQALLRPEFHHLVLGYDFDEWAFDTESEDGKEVAVGETAKVGNGTPGMKGNAGKGTRGQKGKEGKDQTEEDIAKKEEEKEQEMQDKWHKKWAEKARGEVREGSYVRLVGDVVVEFEEVKVEIVPEVRPGVVVGGDKGMNTISSKEQGKNNALRKDISVGPIVGRTKAVQYNYRGEKIDIPDDGIGDPEMLEKLRREAMERKWFGKGKETESPTKDKDSDKPKEDEKPKTTKMICLVVGHMVPVGYDKKFIREMKKAQLKAMEEELGPNPEVASTTGDEMDLDKKDEKSKKKQGPEKPKPWWVETGYRAELEEKRRREEAERLAKQRESIANEVMAKAQEANPSEYRRPDPNKILPPGWENMTIFEVDRLMKEWEKQNKPKEPKPPKPPKPVKKPIITARQAPQFRSSITAQEIFQLQNPDRKPPAKPAGPAYLPLEARPLRRPEEARPVAIEVNQVVQRKILELPPRRQRRLEQGPGPQPQQQPEPQHRPHLQPHPLLRPPQPQPQARVQPRPQEYSAAQSEPKPHPPHLPQQQPQPQLPPQPLLRPQPHAQLPPQPITGPQFQSRKHTEPQSLQQLQRPQGAPQFQPQPQPQQPPRLPHQPQPPIPIPIPPPKPNPYLATDPTIPLKLCTLRQIPHLPYAQNWMINVLAIIVSISDVEPSSMPPVYNQRIVRLADQSTTKHILLNVFLDAEDFNPKPGEVVLLMGVKNHRFEGGSLKKYWSDRPPEGASRCKWWVGEEVLGGIGWCKGMVEGLRGWWREKQGKQKEKEKESEEGG